MNLSRTLSALGLLTLAFVGDAAAQRSMSGHRPMAGHRPMSGHRPMAGHVHTPGYRHAPGYRSAPGYRPMSGHVHTPGYRAAPGYRPMAGHVHTPAYRHVPGYRPMSTRRPAPVYRRTAEKRYLSVYTPATDGDPTGTEGAPAGETSVDLSGTWVGKNGAVTTLTQSGGNFSATGNGGARDPLLLSQGVGTQTGPNTFEGTWTVEKGMSKAWGTSVTTVVDANTIYVVLTGFARDPSTGALRRVSDSGYAYRQP